MRRRRRLGRDADGDVAALAGGLGGVGDEVGEDLAQLGGESLDGDLGGEIGGDGDAEDLEAALHEQQQVVEHLLEVDADGRLGFAIEAEHGAADLGDAGQLGMGHLEELFGLFLLGFMLQEVEEVGNGVEGVVDLVGDGGGEASGDGELLVGQQGGAGFDFEGDVAEDHDDAGDLAGRVADGGSAVVDGEFGAVLAHQGGVVGDGDDALQALHLDDGIFDGLAGDLVDDVEDLIEREVACLGLGPSGEFLGDGVHHLDAAFGVACDDSVADGGKRGAQVLLGLEELFGAAALQVDGAAECGVGGLHAAARVESDEQADGQREPNEQEQQMAGLPAP